MGLENVLGNLGKGFTTGVAKIVDPIGTKISYLDSLLTGVGHSSERAPNTFHNEIYKFTYNDPEKKLDGSKEYIPRVIGTISGLGLAGLGFYSLYAFNPVLGLAAPVITGIYGIVNTIGKYAHDFFKGEKMDSSQDEVFKKVKKILPNLTRGEGMTSDYEKASFEEGFNFGWNSWTHLYMPLVHNVEGALTGRGFNNSRVKSSIKDSSVKMRRNFGAIAGYLVGGVVGAAVSIASFGLFPLYKSVRDTAKNFD